MSEFQKEKLKNLVRSLTRTEKLIIFLYYYEEMTMREIAATLNLSEVGVSRMHSAIIAHLKSAM